MCQREKYGGQRHTLTIEHERAIEVQLLLGSR